LSIQKQRNGVNKMENNLSHAIYEAKHKNGPALLTEAQQSAILDFVGKGCRANTKETLARRLRLPLSLWRDYGIYSRIMFDDKYGASYCCGQSWTDEMRTLRECMIKF
jgi:hypothetical protein